MKFIELHCLAGTRLVVYALLALAQFPSAQGSRGPGYGGTLRVELHDAVISLDPREWKAGAMEAATDEKMGRLGIRPACRSGQLREISAATGDGVVSRCGIQAVGVYAAAGSEVFRRHVAECS